MAPSPHKTLSLKEKVELIRSLDGGRLPTRKIAETWKIGRTQVSQILKNKDEILRVYQSGGNEDVIRIFKGGPGEVIDRAVLEWVSRSRSKNVRLSRSTVQKKAGEIARYLKIDNFKASDGWIDRFKKRHKIEFKSWCGEGPPADPGVVADWCSKITEILEDYDEENIFNADETGLFYCALPSKTSRCKRKTCSEGEMASERLTVLLCASMRGEKIRPLVVGQALIATCFENIDVDELGVDWRADQKAWMTSALMTEWLENLNQEMKRQGRKILLFLDNASCHVRKELENIRLIFFPPNIPPTSQPLDQGVIQNFKIKYRQLALQHLMAILANQSVSVETVAKDIDVLKAVTWIEKSWNDVTPATIMGCFKKAGFPGFGEVKNEKHSADSQELNELLKICPGLADEDYVRIDESLSTESMSEDIADILAAVNPQNEAAEPAEQSVKQECEYEGTSENPLDEADLAPIENYTAALVELKRLQNFYVNNRDQKGFRMINDLMMHHERALSLSVMEKTIKDEPLDC